MEFSTIKDAALLVLMFVVFGAPALALAARIAIRPVLDAMASMRESSMSNQGPLNDRRVALLETQVSDLSSEVRRLAESEAFSRQLIEAMSPKGSLGEGN